MRINFMALIIVLCFAVGANAGETTISYSFSAPEITKNDLGQDSISLPDCIRLGDPGHPVLPVRTAKIMLPIGEEFVSCRVIPSSKTAISGTFIVEHGQTP